MKINRKQFRKWIQALDSGKYSQTRYRMNDSKGHCCMSVACDVLIPKDKISRTVEGYINGRLPIMQEYAPYWLKEINLDFDEKANVSVAQLNDAEKLSFPEIATCLELVYIHKILD